MLRPQTRKRTLVQTRLKVQTRCGSLVRHCDVVSCSLKLSVPCSCRGACVGGFGDQITWLQNDLKQAAANRDAVPWIIVGGHRPMVGTRFHLLLLHAVANRVVGVRFLAKFGSISGW
jgi:hypothetical protein